jgi:hypothetical protein
VPGRLEPSHTPLPLARRLVGVFRTVVQTPVLAMVDAGQYLSLRRHIAFELIGDDDRWHIRPPLQQLPEELLRSVPVPPPLHQDIEDGAVLIHGTPSIIAVAVDGAKDLIQVPRVAWFGPPTPGLIRLRLAELAAPLADGFVGHDHPAGKQPLFDVPIAEAEAVVPPDAVAHDLSGEAVMFVRSDVDGFMAAPYHDTAVGEARTLHPRSGV